MAYKMKKSRRRTKLYELIIIWHAFLSSSDSIIRVYDRRYLAYVDFSSPGCAADKHTVPVRAYTIPNYEDRPFRVTSVNYSSDEAELLVSYSSDHLYLFDAMHEVSNE